MPMFQMIKQLWLPSGDVDIICLFLHKMPVSISTLTMELVGIEKSAVQQKVVLGRSACSDRKVYVTSFFHKGKKAC